MFIRYPMSVMKHVFMFLSTINWALIESQFPSVCICKLNSVFYMQMWELQYPRRILYFDEFPLSRNGRKVGIFWCCLHKLGVQKLIFTPLTVKPTASRLRECDSCGKFLILYASKTQLPCLDERKYTKFTDLCGKIANFDCLSLSSTCEIRV